MYNDEFKLLTEKQGLQTYGLVSNYFIINSINYMHSYIFFLGNSYTSKSFYPYCIRFKTISFLKFKKPFHYYSKKKKK